MSLIPSAPVSRADQAAEALARIAVIQSVETLGAMIDQSDSQSQDDLANLASGRVPPKLGFVVIGDEPDEVAAPGEVGMSRIWRMTRAAWPARRPPDL